MSYHLEQILVINLFLSNLGLCLIIYYSLEILFSKSGHPVIYFLGGMFEYVSGANFLGEIVEWAGFAIATWSLPGLAFSFFTCCNIGPRAYQHHK